MPNNQPAHSANVLDRMAFYGGAKAAAQKLAAEYPNGVYVILLPEPEKFQFEPGAPTKVSHEQGARLIARGSHRLASPEEIAAGRALESDTGGQP